MKSPSLLTGVAALAFGLFGVALRPERSLQECLSPIVLMYYHKTGNLFADAILRGRLLKLNEELGCKAFEHTPRIQWLAGRTHDNFTGCPQKFPALLKGDVVCQRAPDLFCDHAADLFPTEARVLHLVRRPLDMALSHFLYHSQEPTPEEWVTHEVDPCSVSQSMFTWVAPRLNVSRAQILAVAELCRNLWHKDNMYDSLLHYRKSGNLFDGLRLATSQFLLGQNHAGADLMRMANNVLQLQPGKVAVFTVQQHDWLSQPEIVTRCAVEFLTGGMAVENSQLQEIVDALTQAYDKSSDGPHVTQHAISKDERARLLKGLAEDPTLGPLMLNIGRVVDQALTLRPPSCTACDCSAQ